MAQANSLGFINVGDTTSEWSKYLYGNRAFESTPGSSAFLGNNTWNVAERIPETTSIHVHNHDDVEVIHEHHHIEHERPKYRHNFGKYKHSLPYLENDTEFIKNTNFYSDALHCKIPHCKKSRYENEVFDEGCQDKGVYVRHNFDTSNTTSTPSSSTSVITDSSSDCAPITKKRSNAVRRYSPSISATGVSSSIPKTGTTVVSNGGRAKKVVSRSSSDTSGTMKSPTFSSNFSSDFTTSGPNSSESDGSSSTSSTPSQTNHRSTDMEDLGKRAQRLLKNSAYSGGNRRSVSMHGVSQAARLNY